MLEVTYGMNTASTFTHIKNTVYKKTERRQKNDTMWKKPVKSNKWNIMQKKVMSLKKGAVLDCKRRE